MKNLYFILLLSLLGSCKTRKETIINTNFNFERPEIHLIDYIEKGNDGIRVYPSYSIGMSNDYFPNAGKFKYGQPFVYTRDTSSLKTRVTYFYSKPDSVIRLVEYSWNASNRQKNIISQLFRSNQIIISKHFKIPAIEIERKEDDWSQKSIIWENDFSHVTQFMLIQGEPSRVRVLISWK